MDIVLYLEWILVFSVLTVSDSLTEPVDKLLVSLLLYDCYKRQNQNFDLGTQTLFPNALCLQHESPPFTRSPD